MDVTEFLKTLDGVHRAKFGEMSEHQYIEMYIGDGMKDIIHDILDPHWEKQWSEDSGMFTRVHYTDTGHYIEDACLMVPHTVSDIDDDVPISQMDVGDEETSQGYHREWAYIHCGCGEEFTGVDAQNAYNDHL